MIRDYYEDLRKEGRKTNVKTSTPMIDHPRGVALGKGATALDFTLKLGLIPKIFKALIILKDIYIYTKN